MSSGSWFFSFLLRLRRNLRSDRQAAHPLTGRSEDRIAKRRRKRRHARLTHAARRHLNAVLDNVRIRHSWRFVDADNREVVEVALLDTSLLERDLAVFCQRLQKILRHP